jgi:5-methylcytosine-specific restriction endonuclease McrA
MALDSKDKRSMLEEFMLKQDGKCYYCQQKCFIGTIEERINKDDYANIATIEHLLKADEPEYNHKHNLVMACNRCNNKRSNRLLWIS